MARSPVGPNSLRDRHFKDGFGPARPAAPRPLAPAAIGTDSTPGLRDAEKLPEPGQRVDNQPLTLVQVQQRLQQQQLMMAVLSASLADRKPGEPLTTAQHQLFTNVERAGASTDLLRLSLVAHDGPLSSVRDPQLQGLIDAPLFNQAEKTLLGRLEPRQQARHTLYSGLQRQSELDQRFWQSLEGRSIGEPLTALQERILPRLSAQAQKAVRVRLALQDGVQPDEMELVAVLTGSGLDAEQQKLLKTLDSADRAQLQLQDVKRRQTVVASLLAEALRRREPGRKPTRLLERLMGALPPDEQAAARLRMALQDELPR